MLAIALLCSWPLSVSAADDGATAPWSRAAAELVDQWLSWIGGSTQDGEVPAPSVEAEMPAEAERASASEPDAADEAGGLMEPIG